ncbi:MAG: F0F1 ATP synthase subunit B [Isosphaeraceae bacterium]
MPRHSILAFGLAALALALGTALLPRASAADEPHKPAEKSAAGTAGHGLADMTPKDAQHLEGTHGGGGGHSAEEPQILKPEPSLAIWTVVVFLGLLFVLGKFAWKPLLEALHHREEHLEHVLAETEKARNESEQLLAEHRRRLAASEEHIRALIEEARRNATATADEIVRKAQDEAEASKVRAERDISTARDQALSEIWSKTADLAVSVAGKVLDRSLSEDDHRRLVESAVSQLPERPVSTNGHGGKA